MRRSAFDRFIEKVEISESGCWLWTAAISKDGYGKFRDEHSVDVVAHRWSYKFFRGPIPEGMVVDHECHNISGCMEKTASCLHRRCVNPDHFTAKTSDENVKASPNAPSNQPRKTHCLRGHAMTEANTYCYQDPDGWVERHCRICRRDYQRRRRAA